MQIGRVGVGAGVHRGIDWSGPQRVLPLSPASTMPRNPLSAKKLLLSKWTAVTPVARNKHFLVSKIIAPELPETTVTWVELEAVYSKTVQRIAWRDLQDPSRWRQGWV